MTAIPGKPVRVVTGTVHLFTCPVCRQEVMGTVEVAAHLGTLDLGMVEPDDSTRPDQRTMTATLPVVTEARGLMVRHDCRAVQADTEAQA